MYLQILNIHILPLTRERNMFIAAARPNHESFLNNFLWQNICAASLNLIQFFCVQVCNLGRHAVLGEEREGTTVYICHISSREF